MRPLESEIDTYNAHLPTLIKSHGKFALVKGAEIVGVFDTYADAMRLGYEKFGIEPFLVKRIMPPEQVLFISRSVEPCPISACQ